MPTETSYMKKVGVLMRASSSGFKEGEAKEMDGLIDAVGEEDLVGGEAEVRGGGDLGVFAFGVDGEIFRGYRLQAGEDAGRRGEGVLVEVEAEGGAGGEGRVILGRGEDAGAGLRKGGGGVGVVAGEVVFELGGGGGGEGFRRHGVRS